MTECHFANRKQGTAYVQAVVKGKAKVPDELLQVAAPIKAYGYVSDGGGGQTYVEQSFEVIARNIPADYTYTKTAQKTIRDAEVARDQAYEAADTVLTVATEVIGFKNDAQASANAAKKSADSAEYQVGRAKTSADNAGVAMANAQSSAKMSSVHATESAGSAKKSEQSASASATSASEAATSASEAATSASEAKAAAGNAASEVLAATKANADAAAQSATEAETAKDAAATSASNAAESATAAAKSAGNAAASVNAINVIAPKSVAVAATASAVNEVSIGTGATTTGGYSIAIGQESRATIGSIAIGSGAEATGGAGHTSLSIGDASKAYLPYTCAIGTIAFAMHEYSVALGATTKTTKEREVSVGNDNLTREITHVSTPTADTSASTKKYTDDNDAKTLAEAKKYTDDNTTNALIGKVSGKLLHVEDAWPSPLLSVTIDGAYKQDGTPSPDNPVPIEVIENPVVKVTGRNLLDYTRFGGAYYADAGTRLDDAMEVQQLSESSQGFYATRDVTSWNEPHLFTTAPLPAGQYVLSCAIWSDTGCGAYTLYTATSDYVVTRRVEGFQASNNEWTSAKKKTISQAISVSDGERICLYVKCQRCSRRGYEAVRD
nr:MAG TPA: hypothetical protein [Caudoviricetes sp.]